ncbi:MAG TPA: hypothetical protein VFP10_01185, partial [Candidatus Eisenbacteria bacterium]|nr:hypothetical protein [Candidatus Eisenbacteria bacterium]
GLDRQLILPETITVRIILTPVGPHRPGRQFRKTGTTYHQTNNARDGAIGHSNWQDNCTEGHPDGDVGVHGYVENRLVVIKIPLDEECIATADFRNRDHVSIEECVNVDRDPVATEDTTMWLHAAILAARGQNAREHLFPHTNGSGCPHRIHSARRWPEIERGVEQRIGVLNGAGPLPSEDGFEDPIPVPKAWDGTDFRRPADGHLFVALARVFAARIQTAARVSADPQAKKTRADLQPGETFLGHYVTTGSDGAAWLVSERGSRIRAADCLPGLESLASVESITEATHPEQEAILVLEDPERGLSAGEVADDAPALSKEEFMAREAHG